MSQLEQNVDLLLHGTRFEQAEMKINRNCWMSTKTIGLFLLCVMTLMVIIIIIVWFSLCKTKIIIKILKNDHLLKQKHCYKMLHHTIPHTGWYFFTVTKSNARNALIQNASLVPLWHAHQGERGGVLSSLRKRKHALLQVDLLLPRLGNISFTSLRLSVSSSGSKPSSQWCGAPTCQTGETSDGPFDHLFIT